MRPSTSTRIAAAALLLAATAACGATPAADAVAAPGATRSVDERLLLALRHPTDPGRPIGPRWLPGFARDITALGSPGILTLVTLAAGASLWLAGNGRAAAVLALAVFGGLLLGPALKWTIDRPRPDLVPQLVSVDSSSFPSGHSMGAAAAYLTLGALLARMQRRRALQAYLLSLSILLTLLVGLSRVYLGVHWPSDVLAGWVAGALWALACGMLMRRPHARIVRR